jgi:hypothetical protein
MGYFVMVRHYRFAKRDQTVTIFAKKRDQNVTTVHGLSWVIT